MITLDQKIAEYLNNWQPGGWPVGNFVLCIIALVLSLFLCGVIGWEREKRGRSAGLRTHLLVGIGSCVIMIISVYGFPAMFAEKRDVARLAAQVVAGVGFLGAGAIIYRNSGARGLTTAGTIWISMAIGIACGSFNFLLAIASTFVVLAILVVFRRIESNLSKKNPMILITAKPDKPFLKIILETSKEFECVVHDLASSIQQDVDGEELVELVFQARFDGKDSQVDAFMEALTKRIEPKSIEILRHK